MCACGCGSCGLSGSFFERKSFGSYAPLIDSRMDLNGSLLTTYPMGSGMTGGLYGFGQQNTNVNLKRVGNGRYYFARGWKSY